jgi:hypothetical protein
MAREGSAGQADVQASVIPSFSGSYAPNVMISRDLIAAIKPSQEAKASDLRTISLITWTPPTHGAVSQVFAYASTWDVRHRLEDTTREGVFV